MPKKIKWKKTPNNYLKNSQKHAPKNDLNFKGNSFSNNNIKFLQKNKKKHSISSIKVDLKENNKNKSDIYFLLKTNSNENKDKNNLSVETNLINIKEFKAEKINIDLTKIDKTSGRSVDEANNKIKFLNMKKGTNRDNQIENNFIQNTNQIMLNKFMKIISKSNPKTAKEKKMNHLNKKLSLKEARFENKLKYENVSQQKNELINAESFINEYNKNKNNNYTIKDMNQKNIVDRITVNTEPNFDSLEIMKV